jgi:capsular exopolysaccharide synthesis family protein
VSAADDHSPEAVRREAMRVLRSNLHSAIRDLPNPVVMVTSANAGEGKTSTCVPLAQSMAEAGFGVVLVDLDLRHPDAHNLLGVENGVGVADVLSGQASVDDALRYVDQPSNAGLWFMSTGTPVANATELLETSRMGSMFKRVARDADVVLVDSAPVLPVADTLVVGRLAAGALLVVQTRRTAAPAVRRARDMLMRNQTRLLGLVLNRVRGDEQTFRYGSAFEQAPGGLGVPSPNGQE